MKRRFINSEVDEVIEGETLQEIIDKYNARYPHLKKMAVKMEFAT